MGIFVRLTNRMRLFIGVLILSLLVSGTIGIGRVSADTSDEKATINEAFEKENNYKKRNWNQQDIEAKIQKALDEGVMGQAKAEALKKKLASGLIVPKRHIPHVNGSSMGEAKIVEALENGELTQEKADAIMQKLNTRFHDSKKGIRPFFGKDNSEDKNKKWHQHGKFDGAKKPQAQKSMRFMGEYKKKHGWPFVTKEKVEAGIEKALQHGKITQEKADTILDKLKARTGDED